MNRYLKASCIMFVLGCVLGLLGAYVEMRCTSKNPSCKACRDAHPEDWFANGMCPECGGCSKSGNMFAMPSNVLSSAACLLLIYAAFAGNLFSKK